MFRLILTTEEENKIKVNFWNEYGPCKPDCVNPHIL